MGLFYLLLTVAGLSLTYLFIRLAIARGHTALSVTAVMVAVAAALMGVWAGVTGGMAWHGPAVALGLVGGVCGALAFWAVGAALRIGHYGLTNASVPLAAFVPVTVSWIVWSAPVTPLSIAAMLVLFSGLTLIAMRGQRHDRSGARASVGWLGMVLAALACNGAAAITQVAVSRMDPTPTRVFLIAIFSGGAVLLLGTALARREVRPGVLPLGVAAGLTNGLANIGIMASLARFEPAVVYPVIMGGPVIVAFVLSHTLFREKTSPLGYLGVVLGVAGAVLLVV